MAAVSEWIVREYFEALGFFVHQPVKYQVAARRKRLDEEVDLLIYRPGRPATRSADIPYRMVWTSGDLKSINAAVVSVRGWHTDRFSASVMEDHPEMFRFAGERTLERFRSLIGDGRVARILCLPGLPASKKLVDEAKRMLRDSDVDGVLEFKSMLIELTSRIDVKKSYEKSMVLQLLRILKNYDLLKDAQLELFKGK